MVVIVASLFLPFQPQFEVSGSDADTAALLESDAIKVPQTNAGGVGQVSGETGDPLRRNRTSSVHSNSPFSNSEHGNVGSELLDYPNANVSRAQDTLPPPPKVANPGISSDMFMENLTANAVNTGTAGTPANPVHNQGNTSVEEFFSSHPAGSMQAIFGGSGMSSRNYSNVSTPGAEGIFSPIPQHDSTANLLKSVNKSLYQNMIGTSGSPVPASIEGKTQPQASLPTSTVITPRSREVPDFNSSVVDLPKAKHQQQQQYSLPAMRRLHRKSSSAAPSPEPKDTKAAPQHAHGKHPLRPLESGRHISSALKNEVIDESDSDHFSDHEEDSRSKVLQFGGFSSDAKSRASLLTGSKDIFSKVPWKIVTSGKGNGGLKNAITTASSEKIIEEPVKWVGTVGIPTDSISNDVLDKVCEELENNYDCVPVISDDITFKVAYKNFCKQILWPTLHYQIPDNPNSKAFEDHSWNFYQNLNQFFADSIVEAYNEGDTIWVHDYHLMLVPGMVRAKLPNAKIGFFLHVSFPSSEVFRCFAQRENILNGIVGANYVGFQTEEYARHFLQTTNGLLMTDVDKTTLKYKGRIIDVGHVPIGIDTFNLDAELNADSVQNWRQLIRSRWPDKKLIVGRDQFDRIRGLKKKLLAYERFLRANPEYVTQTVLIQICLGSEKNPELERELMIVIDRINALSPDISTSQPVVFLHQDLEFAQYLALNSEADLFLITTMREGMNLTCHEFIVSSRERNAPLLLSEFTGSAYIMKDGAYLINPWDIKQVAQTIKRALELPYEEKRRRWKTLYKCIMKNDSDYWVKESLNGIADSWYFNKERSTVFNLSYDTMLSSYKATKKRVFIFKISEPPTARTLSILADLSAHSIVYVFSAFSRNMMERLYTRAAHVGLIAENGAYVRLNNRWFSIVEDISWKSEVAKVIEDKVERLPGSYCKEGESMIRFHTENADDKERISGVVGEAITHVNTLFGDRGIHAYLHKSVVFVQQTGLSLKAAQFLIAYFNSVNANTNSTPQHSVENSPLLSPLIAPSVPNGVASPLSQGGSNSYFSLGRNTSHIDFLAVTGSTSPVVEPLFEYVNEMVKKRSVKAGYSVVYGVSLSTYAKEHIEGLNELLSMLEKLNHSN